MLRCGRRLWLRGLVKVRVGSGLANPSPNSNPNPNPNPNPNLSEADAAPAYARVCFAFLEEEQLAEAGRRLGRAIAAGRSGSSSGD